jgi:hypothetical protein
MRFSKKQGWVRITKTETGNKEKVGWGRIGVGGWRWAIHKAEWSRVWVGEAKKQSGVGGWVGWVEGEGLYDKEKKKSRGFVGG